MRPDAIELDEAPLPPHAPPQLALLDEDALRLALSGGSVIDWFSLNFRTYEDVNEFLALSLCDVTRHEWARERLRYVYNQAVSYLEEHLQLTFPREVRRPRDVRDAFLRASMRDRFSRHRIQYCAILKLMHVVNHLEMQELRNQVAVREIDIVDLAHQRVLQAARQMRAAGYGLRAFYGNRKTRPSVISKLLAKREATAATVFDKLRFRVVTETRQDIVHAVAWLFRNLLPFPAVIPGESHNNLVSVGEILRHTREPPEVARIARDRDLEDVGDPPTNPDSGEVYRVANFVVDLPVRVYDLPGVIPPRNRALLGEAVHVLCEFQVVDAETELANDSGDNRHELYKARQMNRVYQRLGRHPRDLGGGSQGRW
jgi:uncharacterized protein (TIGR04552 family)